MPAGRSCRMQTVPRADADSYEFGPDQEPVVEVDPGERFRVETRDARDGTMFERGGGPFAADPDGLAVDADANPVAGPIRVVGADDGDVLAVRIESIEPGARGWTATREGTGALAGRPGWADCEENRAALVEHEPGDDGSIAAGRGVMEVDGRRWRWPLEPHVGTIATAPRRRGQHSLTSQGRWGGNLDVPDVAPGHTVYLNSFNEGGLLFLGDVHASQGDGELTGVADETPAEVVLSVDVLPDHRVPGVCRIETPTHLIQVDAARRAGGMQRALSAAYAGALSWTVEDHGLSRREALLQATVHPGVDATVYQFVPAPLGFFVCGVAFPKAALDPADAEG